MTSTTLFRSVDVGVFAAALTERLRTAGVEVGLSAAGRFSQGMTRCAPTDSTTLYWVARTCLVHDRSDFDAFDAVFAAVFEDSGLELRPHHREVGQAAVKTTGTLLRQSAPTGGLEEMAGRVESPNRPEIVDAGAENDGPARVLPELMPSAIAELSDTPFDQLDRQELDLLGSWLEAMLVDFPTRRSRRSRGSKHHGRVDLRRTLMAARATSGEPIRLHHRQIQRRRRGVVMVADVSGSMESFTRIYLHLMRSLVTHGDAEVFTFTTSLRRVTVQLRDRDPQAAIDRLSDEVSDRFGGTRIAASVSELVTSPVWSNALRGSVVLVASDGWDADPPAELERQMVRLRRMAHRVVWLNPRSAAEDYEPLVAGMAVAMPFVDEFLSGHSLAAMRDVFAALDGS